MSINAAIQNEIFLTYLAIVGGLLLFAGLVLAILGALGRDSMGE